MGFPGFRPLFDGCGLMGYCVFLFPGFSAALAGCSIYIFSCFS